LSIVIKLESVSELTLQDNKKSCIAQVHTIYMNHPIIVFIDVS